MIVGQSRY